MEYILGIFTGIAVTIGAIILGFKFDEIIRKKKEKQSKAPDLYCFQCEWGMPLSIKNGRAY